ncbi:hypothetical protein [Acinetobacter junii]|jgi:hypothetical protein|uniref:hypothetical protein n=2 Tax=Acinetobacter junii TaxID=40215 RepID=UPI0002CECD5D|nr:hypothetical protein [Acinetobacter junii]AWA46937.1 hypothetical protein CDG57_02305 [Acinetobacter junii]ENV65888.1 hypothetical protein F948_02585 [Acinetobacter junii CIP 64.5]MBL8280646.1 hypothetical protein [Acinetobacter junii]MCE6005733.1 hypothetical protein [Acinetobacter junii]MDA3506707.1 hypothetical protein [Acinetobacter junii]
MKGLFLCIGITLSIPTTFACAPLSPNDVFIARVKSVQKINSINHTKFKLQHPDFAFKNLLSKIISPRPKEWMSDFPVKTIKTNDLIMGLAYPSNHNAPQKYQIVSLALLHCKENTISIDLPIAPFTAWNRRIKGCNNESSIRLLDGFLEHDESFYLKKTTSKISNLRSSFFSLSQIIPIKKRA